MLPAASTTIWALVKPFSASSVTPTAKAAPRRLASPATASSAVLSLNCPTSITFSGHTTRSRSSPGESSCVASRCRSKTSRGFELMASTPCGPPPCTRAIRKFSPVSLPRGATPPSTCNNTTTAIIDSALRRVRHPNSALFSHSKASAPPTSATHHDKPSGPTTRPTCARRVSATPSARLASGTPPNGQKCRNASTSASIVTRATTRSDSERLKRVAIVAPTACMIAKSSGAMTKPPGTSCHIQPIAGANHDQAKTSANPNCGARRNATRSATTTYSVIPAIAVGHTPQGGNPRAISNPPSAASATASSG